MHRAYVVLLALASIASASRACQPSQSAQDCAVITNNLGSASFAAGKYQEAEQFFTRAIALWSTQPPPSDDLAKALHNLGAVYSAEEKYSDAARFLLRALDLRESLCGPAALTLLPILNDLGRAYLELGDYVQAENILQRALAIVEAHPPEDSAESADAM